MENVLEITNLTKVYGRHKAVNDLNLEVPRGSVYGLLGPNGSGKTTTLGSILGVIRPTRGTYSWFGKGNSKYERRRIGAILETPNFLPYLTGEQNLKIIADVRGTGQENFQQTLERVNLGDWGKSKFRQYSLGMKQRLALAAATLHEPEVLILDEPTNGLDPQGIAEVRGFIRQIAESGTTIILASHLLDEVQKVCSHVAVLRKGEMLYSGAVDQLMAATTRRIYVAADDMNQLATVAQGFGATQQVSSDEGILMVDIDEASSARDLNAHLIAQGITLSHLQEVKKTLEQQFLEMLSDSDQPAQ